MRQQALNLLASGSTKQQVLSITGMSEAAYEEMLASEDFVADLKERAAANRETQIEESYSKLEYEAIKKVKGNMEYYDAVALCRVLETVAKVRATRKTTAAATAGNGHFNNPTLGITVQIPVFLGNSKVILDSNKQVVAIDGRNMAALPTDQVHKLFNELEKGSQNEQGAENDPILADLAEIERDRAQLAA